MFGLRHSLSLAGGVALNCLANGRIRRESPFDELFVQPAAGDSGAALGAAAVVHRALFPGTAIEPMGSARLGPDYSTGSGRVPQAAGRGLRGARGGTAARADGPPAGRWVCRGLVSGTDGVRPAGAGFPLDPGQPRRPADEGPPEQGQGPRAVPALRAQRARGARR